MSMKRNHNPCVGGSNPSSATNISIAQLYCLLVLSPFCLPINFGTSPNDFKIVASLKFPMFGSPLRLNARAPALAASRDIGLGPPYRG
jgi:hypothetical protein